MHKRRLQAILRKYPDIFEKSFFYHQFLLSYPLSYLQRHERWHTSVPLISKKEARELIRESSMPSGEKRKEESQKRTLRMKSGSPESLYRGKSALSHSQTFFGPGDDAFWLLFKLLQDKIKS